MGRGILAALLAAAAMFVWGYVSWILLPLHEMKGFSNSMAVAETLRASGDESGVYWIPGPPKSQDEDSPEHKRWVEEHERGPLAMVIYDRDGGKVMDPKTMVKGFVVLLASCFIVATMLSNARIGNFFGRLAFCTAFGLFVAVYADGGNWAWFSFPMDWTVTAAIDRVIPWAVGGAVLAGMIKP